MAPNPPSWWSPILQGQLPPGAPTPEPGESQTHYEARLNKWMKDWLAGKVGHEPLGPLPPTSDIGNAITGPLDFLKALANPNTWVRVGEVVVGVVLLAVGVDHMMGTNYVGKASKVAKTAAML